MAFTNRLFESLHKNSTSDCEKTLKYLTCNVCQLNAVRKSRECHSCGSLLCDVCNNFLTITVFADHHYYCLLGKRNKNHSKHSDHADWNILNELYCKSYDAGSNGSDEEKRNSENIESPKIQSKLNAFKCDLHEITHNIKILEKDNILPVCLSDLYIYPIDNGMNLNKICLLGNKIECFSENNSEESLSLSTISSKSKSETSSLTTPLKQNMTMQKYLNIHQDSKNQKSQETYKLEFENGIHALRFTKDIEEENFQIGDKIWFRRLVGGYPELGCIISFIECDNNNNINNVKNQQNQQVLVRYEDKSYKNSLFDEIHYLHNISKSIKRLTSDDTRRKRTFEYIA